MAVILDTGILYAAGDADDAWHERAASLLAEETGLRVVPVTVVPEVCYLLHARLGVRAERAFLDTLGRELPLEPLLDRDLDTVRGLLDAKPEIGFVDASVGAIAARLGIARIATTDRRHFTGLALPGGLAVELVP